MVAKRGSFPPVSLDCGDDRAESCRHHLLRCDLSTHAGGPFDVGIVVTDILDGIAASLFNARPGSIGCGARSSREPFRFGPGVLCGLFAPPHGAVRGAAQQMT
ncbi:MAG: hypothetical protein WD942_08640 [Dehalococcoidia bacterium]